VLPTISKTQCNTDLIAQTVLAETSEDVETFQHDNPLCAGYEADLGGTIDLAQAEGSRRLGLLEGVRLAYEAMRARLVTSWECEACTCVKRMSGTGPCSA